MHWFEAYTYASIVEKVPTYLPANSLLRKWLRRNMGRVLFAINFRASFLQLEFAYRFDFILEH